MKKNLIFLFSLVLSFSLTSCFKDYDKEYFEYTKQTVEFDDAVSLSKVSGKYYPLLSSINGLKEQVKYRINLFGVQSKIDETIKFRIDTSESDAIEGRDYEFIGSSSEVTIPANSSYGYITLKVLPTIVGEKTLVLELLGNDHIAVATNYRGIGIPMTAYGSLIDSSNKDIFDSYMHVRNVTIGNYTSVNNPQFIDLKNAITYYWAGAQAVEASNINFTYMHSGSTSSNEANLVPPGFSTMSATWGSSTYNKFLTWNGTKLTALFYKISNPSSSLLLNYQNINSAADIKSLFTTISGTSGATSGERITKVTSGDLIGYYCPELGYYAILKINEALTWAQFATMGITSDTDFYMNFDYKVQL